MSGLGLSFIGSGAPPGSGGPFQTFDSVESGTSGSNSQTLTLPLSRTITANTKALIFIGSSFQGNSGTGLQFQLLANGTGSNLLRFLGTFKPMVGNSHTGTPVQYHAWPQLITIPAGTTNLQLSWVSQGDTSQANCEGGLYVLY